LVVKESLDLNKIAKQLANFINELHLIDIDKAPEAGKHNFYRGCPLDVYNDNHKENLNKIQNQINTKKALDIWQESLDSKWHKDPVWIHGDLAVGNILIKNKKINAIIDFGGMAIGDPACDLVLYWNFFNEESRSIFKSNLNLDQETWSRARGWAIWKACYELTQITDKKSQNYLNWLNIINNIQSN